MTRVYRVRRYRLMDALSTSAGRHLTIERPAGGVQLRAYLDPKRDDREISRRLAAAGVTAQPLSPHFTGTAASQALFLGFAAWTEQEIDKAAATIGRVLNELAGPVDRAGARENDLRKRRG